MKYINAEEFIADTENMRTVADAISIDGILKYVDEHKVEAVEPIYCKDCEYFDGASEQWGCCSEYGGAVMQCDYCSRAVRRDGND